MLTHSQRVWSGDLTAVRDAERNYLRDPEKFLMQFAVALYSFRNNQQCAEKLVWLRDGLRLQALEYLKSTDASETFLDQLDTISTHLEWISRHDSCPESDRAHYRFVALRLAEQGIQSCISQCDPPGSVALLALTRARIAIARDDPRAGHLLYVASRYVRKLADVRQRARARGKLGLVNRLAGNYVTGYWHGLRALLYAPRVPLNVTLKNIAALLGIDR